MKKFLTSVIIAIISVVIAIAVVFLTYAITKGYCASKFYHSAFDYNSWVIGFFEGVVLMTLFNWFEYGLKKFNLKRRSSDEP